MSASSRTTGFRTAARQFALAALVCTAVAGGAVAATATGTHSAHHVVADNNWPATPGATPADNNWPTASATPADNNWPNSATVTPADNNWPTTSATPADNNWPTASAVPADNNWPTASAPADDNGPTPVAAV
ncbi:hypothetical protein Shyhy01_72400 [Streptomyces hygroscopicus subsp. hygroscopicus]|nr:hypothetical protein [Streptomyces hygroscopicus]GLX54291.1 hypothetical protein Shyhy01_72400 [Streptomyces hygroscopicus subsp. hygroscopicus]